MRIPESSAMFSRSLANVFLVALLVGPAVFLLEVMGGFWLGAAYPLPLWYFAAALLLTVVLSAAAASIIASRGLFSPGNGVLVVLPAWAVILVKVAWVGGMGSVWPYVFCSLPFLTIMLVSLRGGRSRSELHWMLVTLVLVLLSSDLYHELWLATSGEGPRAWAAGLGVWVAGTLLMVPEAAAQSLPRLVRKNLMVVLSAFLLIVLGVLLSWSNQSGTSWWNEEPYYVGRAAQPELSESFHAPDAPNVVMISLDGLGHRVLEPNRLEELPNLRSLREDGIRFRKTFSTSSWILPGQASLFTGRLPHEHRAVSHLFSRLPPTMKTYPQYLQRAGYRTLGFTGGGYTGARYGFGRGFHRFHQEPSVYDGFLPGALELTAVLLANSRYRLPFQVRDHEPLPARPFSDVLERARGDLEPAAARREPFFMFLQTHEVRDYLRKNPTARRRLRREKPRLARALDSPDRASLPDPVPSEAERRRFLTREASFSDTEWRRFRTRIRGFTEADWERTLLGYSVQILPPVPLRQLKEHVATMGPERWRKVTRLSQDEINFIAEWNLGALRRLKGLSPARLKARKRLHHHAVRSVDEQIGKWIQRLRRHDLYEESLIVVVSSHGEGFSRDPLIVGNGARLNLDRHGQLHDRLIQVPLLVKLPDNRGAGRTYDGMLQITDVFPLVLDELGITPGDPSAVPEEPDLDLGAIAEGRSPEGRSTVRGSVESGKLLEPKFFVRGASHKYTLDAGWRLREYWRVPERSHEDYLAPGNLDPESRRRLEQTMTEHVLDFYRPPHAYPRLRPGSRRFLSRHLGEVP